MIDNEPTRLQIAFTVCRVAFWGGIYAAIAIQGFVVGFGAVWWVSLCIGNAVKSLLEAMS